MGLRTPTGVGGSDLRAYVDSTHSGAKHYENSLITKVSGANFAFETDFVVGVVAIRLRL